MAEETLTLIDKLKGEKAEVVGRNNKKNGPDRKVNGIEIQTKYCLNGKKSINACFDKTTGQFRYKNSLGETMVIEVPKDQYAEAINEFRKKILENKVPGVTNPNDASKYIKKGKLTYNQALNLCKPGTIESLSYDAATGAINCSFAFGITFLTTYIFSYSRDGKQKEALNNAIKSGIDVFGLSFLTHICAQQVARTNFSNIFIPLSNNFVKHMSPNTIKTIVNSMRSMSGKNAISGAAASSHLAKVLRSNVITSAITFTVFSIPDTYGVFKKNISGAQYTKNMLSLIGSMATAGAGTLATSLGTAKIGGITGTKILPGVGTVIGIVGGLTGGLLGGSVIKLVGDDIREDDTVILSRLFNAVVINLIYEYMLSESEINVIIEKLNLINKKEFKKLISNVMAAEKQEKVIEKFLRHYYEEIIRNRASISEPTEEEIIKYVEKDEGEE